MVAGGVGLFLLAPAPASPWTVPDRSPEGLLLAEADRLGWTDDPVIAGHLGRVLDLPPDLAVAEAARIGLLRRDPVVRARLLDRMSRALRTADADDATLAAHLAASSERFRRPDAVQLRLSRADGRPLPLGVAPEGWWTLDRARAALPAAVFARIDAARPGDGAETDGWRWHLVERRPGGVPPLAEIRAEVLADWRRHTTDGRRRALLAALADEAGR